MTGSGADDTDCVAAINGLSDFASAVVEADQLMVFSLEGEEFSLALEVQRENGSVVGDVRLTASDATSALATLGGTLTLGEEWTVLLTINPGTLDEVSVLVGHTVSLIDHDEDSETPDVLETLDDVAY